MHPWRTFFIRTLRGRLILGVAAVHAVMMSLFIIDLTTRERAMLLDRQHEEAQVLAQALATSAAGWIAAADVSGLQELVEAQRRYPELVFAMITDNRGLILAHTEPERLGLSVLDLPREIRQTLISQTSSLADEAVPAMLAGQHLGWARVGVGQMGVGAQLAAITRNGIIYALVAVMAGSIMAWFMGYRITRRLYVIQKTIDEVRSGNRLARSRITGSDEAAVMARGFNAMLDALDQRDEELRASEEALHEAGSYNRRLIEASLDPLVTIGPEGKITDVNAATEAATGYSRAEMVGRDFSEYFTAPAQAEAGYQQVFREGAVRNYPLELRHRNGEVMPVLYNASVYRDEQGQIIGAFAAARDITELKRAEEKLRHLAAIVESSDDAIIGKTLDQKILSWNQGAERIYGYTAAEMLGCTIAVLVPPGFEDEMEAIMERVRHGEGVEHFETTRRCKVGRLIQVALTISPIRDDRGQVIGASTIARDITERVHLIRRDRMRTSALVKLTQGAPLPQILDSIVRGMEEENPDSIASILLLDETGRHLQRGAAPSLPPFYNDAINGLEIGPEIGACGAAAFTGQQVVVEDIATHPFWPPYYRELAARAGLAACWSEPIVNRQGRVLGTLAIYRKVPAVPTAKELEWLAAVASLASVVIEHKATQAQILDLNAELEQRVADRTRELAASEERFYEIYETAPVSIWLEDWTEVSAVVAKLRTQGVTDFADYFREHPEVVAQALAAVKILDVNQWTTDMFAARDKVELLASLATIFATPDALPGFVSELLALVQGQTAFRTEITLNTVKGDLLHGLLAMSFPPPGSGSGNVLACVVDITGRKLADNQIRDLNEQLAARAQSLELANKELESFSYSVSHDLRAPLRAIDGFSRMVLEDSAEQLDPEGRANLGRVRAASQRMGQLIDDILQLSRLTLSAMQRESVDMSALARIVVADLQCEEPDRQVDAVIESGLTANADPNLMRIVLANLLGNAWKFTGKQPAPKIEFGCATVEGVPAFYVRDNGVGFDMAYAHKLFGAFQRLHTTAEFPGTGIGLATVQRVIRRHNGRVWTASQIGHGATFYFTLPTDPNKP